MWKWTLDNLWFFLTHAYSHKHHSRKRIYLKWRKKITKNKIYFYLLDLLCLTYSICDYDLRQIDSDIEVIRKLDLAFTKFFVGDIFLVFWYSFTTIREFNHAIHSENKFYVTHYRIISITHHIIEFEWHHLEPSKISLLFLFNINILLPRTTVFMDPTYTHSEKNGNNIIRQNKRKVSISILALFFLCC